MSRVLSFSSNIRYVDAKQIEKLTVDELKSIDPRIDFKVVAAAIREEDGWWYVPVITYMKGGRPAPRDFAVAILAKVEQDVFLRHKQNVLFIPSSAAA